MAQRRVKCSACGERVAAVDATRIAGKAGGNYRRPLRTFQRVVCRGCTERQVAFARERGVGVNSGLYQWEDAAFSFGIEVEGLRGSAFFDRPYPKTLVPLAESERAALAEWRKKRAGSMVVSASEEDRMFGYAAREKAEVLRVRHAIDAGEV